ncbi:MAG: A/G-specific adenine glycosylase [Planctomycetota bacterium]
MQPAANPTAAEPTAAFEPSQLSAALARWFASARRDLPWRSERPDGTRDAYAVLVSEIMLQQTQAARVAERFPQFIARFPTAAALAAADEQDVLAAWAGMGYYRRARSLHAAAKVIASDHEGDLPRDPAALRALPGVGDYTAGAIASIAFNIPAPAVDANVMRVMLRLLGVHATPADTNARATVRDRTAELSLAARSPAILTESLMELGATLCTQRSPACDRCPVAAWCNARAAGTQSQIPLKAPKPPKRPLFAVAHHILDPDGRVLIQRRPESGLWAGMYQLPTIESDDAFQEQDPSATVLGGFEHQTTHRRVLFRVVRVSPSQHEPLPDRAQYREIHELAALPFGSAQRRALSIAGIGPDTDNARDHDHAHAIRPAAQPTAIRPAAPINRHRTTRSSGSLSP